MVPSDEKQWYKCVDSTKLHSFFICTTTALYYPSMKTLWRDSTLLQYNCDCDFKMTCFNLVILYKQCKIFFTYICKPFKLCNSMTFINQFTSFWKIHSSLKESARGNFWRFSIFCSCYLFLFVSMMLAIVYFPILI